jgi:YHS domain-containing protein
MVQDPVCGQQIDPAEAEAISEYQGDRFYFCCEECKEEFDRDPTRYIRAPHPAEVPDGAPVDMR